MKKRYAVVAILAVFAVAALVGPSSARIWTARQVSIDLGWMPSMALLYGVQPVVSNRSQVIRLTAFGEEPYTTVSGYIGGDGGSRIVGNNKPVYHGNDGRFYSYTGNPPMPIEIHGGVGPVWPYETGGSSYAPVGADSAGGIYMACGHTIAKLVGGAWSPAPTDLASLGIQFAADMDVSPFGDLAVFGWGSGTAVAWYDFKTSLWSTRRYDPALNAWGDLEWDAKGNLGMAYSTLGPSGVLGGADAVLNYDYLDMSTGLWTSEVVSAGPDGYYVGVALAFDRFDNPVIASGRYVFYDPIAAPVPEPSALAVLVCGLTALAGRVRLRRI